MCGTLSGGSVWDTLRWECVGHSQVGVCGTLSGGSVHASRYGISLASLKTPATILEDYNILYTILMSASNKA